MEAQTLDMLASLGWAVFPLPPGGRVPERGWQRAVTLAPDPAQFPAGSNLGIGCRASRVVVLDLDMPDGVASLELLCTQYRQELPPTFTVSTPSGGEHRYFRVGEECTIGSGSSVLRPGIDVRGPGLTQGGYVVGPGSVVDGKPYTAAAAPVAPLPRWLDFLLVSTMRTLIVSGPDAMYGD
ncbi:bifunctional DNA primase/polymerase [Streptomyces sp. NPDC087440]|uniref:bifunctional DNA primase/polymerase n=1 Tax=Streptomyces sp. NPDC087440 TaxID=3365790 RepID=UPI0037FF7E96